MNIYSLALSGHMVSHFPLFLKLRFIFLFFIFPPNTPAESPSLHRWQKMGGPGLLLHLPLMFISQAVREALPSHMSDPKSQRRVSDQWSVACFIHLVSNQESHRNPRVRILPRTLRSHVKNPSLSLWRALTGTVFV